MGKQITYYSDRECFLNVAQFALEQGCIIIKENWLSDGNIKLEYSDTLDIVNEEAEYYFYYPEAGELETDTIIMVNGKSREYICSGKAKNAVIETGFSSIDEKNKRIYPKRLYIQTGYYDDEGIWIPRPESITKLHEKLVRSLKKQVKYSVVNGSKEYISPYFLNLVEKEGYSLY